ncbi:PEP-CTERM sorting domain-containing protein, partial [Nodularia sphaerocarpa]
PVSTPEPGALIGFSMLGLYFFNRRAKYQQS